MYSEYFNVPLCNTFRYMGQNGISFYQINQPKCESGLRVVFLIKYPPYLVISLYSSKAWRAAVRSDCFWSSLSVVAAKAVSAATGVEEPAAAVEHKFIDMYIDKGQSIFQLSFHLIKLIIILLSVSLSISIALWKVSSSSAAIVSAASSAFTTDSRERSWRFSCLRLKFSAAYLVIFGWCST